VALDAYTFSYPPVMAHPSGILVNNAAGYNKGHTSAMTVSVVDATTVFKANAALYKIYIKNDAGAFLFVGKVTAVADATTITVGGGLLHALTHLDELYVELDAIFNKEMAERGVTNNGKVVAFESDVIRGEITYTILYDT
tara:strand:+ start:967 stop:1386 length:420 start_codon:yes stop_codon:yes gene_type:complete